MTQELGNTSNNKLVLSVGICIPTFKRPEGLLKLLKSIGKQVFKKVEQPSISVFVADNDAAASSREIVERLACSYPFPLHYEAEERRGIPFVRNRLVSMTRGYDLIAFVDDDEEVIASWLDELCYVYEKTGAQVVAGRVVGRLPTNAPRWAMEGKFYESPLRETGTLMSTFYTNNVLLERKLLNVFEKPFEESMAFCGGTDSLLAMRVLGRGAKCVWCQEAEAFEDVPDSRLTINWYLRRRYRNGNSSVYCNRNSGEDYKTHYEICRSVKLTFLSVAVCLSSVFRGSHKFLKGLGYFSQAIGIVTATLKMQVNEYGRSDYR